MKEFLETYHRLSADNLHLLADIYSPSIQFTDPAHELRGLDQLTAYFRNLYANLTSVHFDFQHPQRLGDVGYVQWLMTYSHPRINKGEEISVHGASFLQFDGNNKVCVHRDFFDLGALLYQHLPIIGPAVRFINRRMGQ